MVIILKHSSAELAFSLIVSRTSFAVFFPSSKVSPILYTMQLVAIVAAETPMEIGTETGAVTAAMIPPPTAVKAVATIVPSDGIVYQRRIRFVQLLRWSG